MNTDRIIVAGIVELLAPLAVSIRNKILDANSDRGIALMLSGVGDDDLIAVGTKALQVRTRGLHTPSDDVDDLAEEVFSVLHGYVALQLVGVTVGSIRRMSWVSLGQDGNKRWERSDNYLLEGVTAPASSLLPG